MRITTVAEARKAIGKVVYWDDIGTRYIFLRQGTLERAWSRTVVIDGDYKERGNLKNLRTTKEDVCHD